MLRFVFSPRALLISDRRLLVARCTPQAPMRARESRAYRLRGLVKVSCLESCKEDARGLGVAGTSQVSKCSRQSLAGWY